MKTEMQTLGPQSAAASGIIVIGLCNEEDLFTLSWIGCWLKENRRRLGMHDDLLSKRYDVYDMSTLPEKGDALDAIGPATKLVIALHLFGIDKLPGGSTATATALDPGYLYNRENIQLLERCMRVPAALVAVGDQPWLGMEKRTIMHANDPEVVLYEPRTKKP